MTDFTLNMVNGIAPSSIVYDFDYFLIKLNTIVNAWQFCFPDGSFYTSGNIYPFAKADNGPTNNIWFGSSASTSVDFNTDFKILIDQLQAGTLQYIGGAVAQSATHTGYAVTMGIFPADYNKIFQISPATGIINNGSYANWFQKTPMTPNGIPTLRNYNFSGITTVTSGDYVYFRIDYDSSGNWDLYGWMVDLGWSVVSLGNSQSVSVNIIDNSVSLTNNSIAFTFNSPLIYNNNGTGNDIGYAGGIGTVGSALISSSATIPPLISTSIIIKIGFNGIFSGGWQINLRNILAYDVSINFTNQVYITAPSYFFYVWLNLIGGSKELSFAINSTNINPGNWKVLVYILGWIGDGNNILTKVSGAKSTSLKINNVIATGNGQGGSFGYNEAYESSYKNISASSATGNWTQNNNNTSVLGNVYPSGGTWGSALSTQGLYKVTLRSEGGFLFENVTPVCYRGDSLISVLNKATNEPELKLAKKITKDDLVFSVTQNKFVPVLLNIATYKNKHYKLLKKNCLGENKPSEDLYMTPGHPILYNGQETQASCVKEAVDFYCEEEEVYSIATNKREYILVNNVPSLTWSYFAWKNVCINGKNKYAWNINDKKPQDFSEITVKLIGDENLEPKNIMISKNEFGLDNPKYDITVNENYKLLVDGVEIEVKDMVNGNGINIIY
jgi:hypothetical protein